MKVLGDEKELRIGGFSHAAFIFEKLLHDCKC